MSDETIRCFLAIAPDPKTRTALVAAIEQLRGNIEDKNIRWIDTDNLHITLRFIGNFAVAKLDRLQQEIQNALQSFAPFTIQITQAHLFPSAKHPRVIALHIQPVAPLQRLAKALDVAVVTLGMPEETRPFRDHLTIARIKNRVIIDEQKLLINDCIECLVQEVVLYQSISRAQGVEYHCLAGFDLG